MKYAIKLLKNQQLGHTLCSHKEDAVELQQAISALKLIESGKPPKEVVERYVKECMDMADEDGFYPMCEGDLRNLLETYFQDCFKGEQP